MMLPGHLSNHRSQQEVTAALAQEAEFSENRGAAGPASAAVDIFRTPESA